MAQNAKISALSDELIQTILNFDPASNKQAYKHAKDMASRALRGHHYARTNQFDVTARLAGLDEKFRIKNRDDLADALQARLKKLDNVSTKFKPDCLSLLLQLADRPLENTQIEALELLRQSPPPPPLTWQEILQEDPYSDEDIWNDIDYAVESSDEEKVPQKRGKTKSTAPTSTEEEDPHGTESYVVASEDTLVARLEAVQFWTTVTDDDDAKATMTELQAIRETLFMLSGLQTSLYLIDQEHHTIEINPKFILGHAMTATVNHLLSQFAFVGKTIYRLRQWLKNPSTIPLMQTFEAAVRRRLLAYDQSLAHLQQLYLVPKSPIPVSLLKLFNEVQPLSANILRLAQLVFEIEPQLLVNPFSHLEALFEQTTLAQLTLDEEAYEYMAKMFFDCLQTYLKPIRTWMQEGELGNDDETFFVFINDSSRDTASIWHDQYVLRRNGMNQLRSPTFLQPAAQKIFNTGKAVVLLKELDLYDASMSVPGNEPRLDHEAVCSTNTLLPFPQLFQAAFDSWIRSKYSIASAVLRQYIFDIAGLTRVLATFETMYLCRNGAVFQDFANAVFDRMDTEHGTWGDRYVLSEIAQGVFGTLMPASEAEKIVVRSAKVKSRAHSVKELTGVSIDYALHWCIQNIIQRSSVPVYQQVFTFLIQLYRVKFLLQRARPLRAGVNKRSQPRFNDKLRHRFTCFIDTLRSYLTGNAIFFTSQDMSTMMGRAEDIDEMSLIHTKFITRLQERAILSKDLKPIHKAIIEVLDLSVQFAETIGRTSENGTSEKKKKSLRSRKRRIGLQEQDEQPESEFEIESEDEQKSKPTEQSITPKSSAEVLLSIDKEFSRLLPFIVAGLKSVGRVGAEPMLGQLAERLEWDGASTSAERFR